jgi:drug/metabolite transporter (DMT)-like permease
MWLQPVNATTSLRVMKHDRPLLGIALMFAFCVFAPLGDAVAKLLAGAYALGFLVFVRFSAQVIILGPIVIFGRLSWRLSGRLLGLVVLRGGLHITGIFAMFASLTYLPLAEAVAIAFVMPFIMLLLGWWILDEPVGPRRIAACAVGFIGTLLVVQPSFAQVGWPALLPLVVAVVFSVFMLITRKISRQTDPIALQAVTGAMACAALAVIMWLGSIANIQTLAWHWPSTGDWPLIVLLGTLGTLGHLCMTWALRYAPSTVLAPMQYLEIPIATAIGWWIFADLPNGLAAIGIIITIGAGISIIIFERLRAKAT